jgi:hypothetical protein
MNVILTMKIKNGGSTVQMNSADTYIKDAQVVVLIVRTNHVIQSSISF